MSIITGKGKEIMEQMNKAEKAKEGSKIDFKKVKINKDLKKEGDSIRVRLLSAEDFTSYESHGHFNKGIYTAPCIHPAGERCLFCEASKADEEFEDLKAKTRFLFAFYDIDEEMVRVLEVSFGQGKALMGNISDYEDSIDDIAFTLKRTGTGTKTGYQLAPILKLKGNDQSLFDAGAEETVPEDFYEKVLYVKSTKQMAEDLQNAGFDLSLIGYELKDDDEEEGNEEPQENKGGEVDPNKVF